MAVRPCCLVVDREMANGISSRKLVLETAKFNVVTAFSADEALATMERFPRIHAAVVSSNRDGESEQLLRDLRAAYPDLKLVLTGEPTAEDVPCDSHVPSYAPELLLLAIRKLFPEASEATEARERVLEAEQS